MKDYFQLQHKMLQRKWVDFGVPLWIAYSASPILFVLLSYLLFEKLNYAAYVYAVVALGVVSKLSEPNRNQFLQSIFSKRDYTQLRIIENLIVALPFILFLIFKTEYWLAIGLSFASILTALLKLNTSTNFTIPTPFGKKPYEFTVGFRNTYFLFPIVYGLTFISIQVNNYNLGIFAMAVLALVCIFYYAKPEDKYFVWNFNRSPQSFLVEKVITGIINFTFLSLPIIATLSIYFTDEITITLLLFLLCFVYLITFILAKYAAYPNEINISQGMFLGISLVVPPILIGLIPYFYLQSVKKLNPILHDPN